MTDERVARLEAIIESHEKQLDYLRGSLESLRNDVSHIREEIAALKQGLKSYAEEGKRSLRRTGIVVAGILGAAEILVTVILYLLHP